MYDAGLTQEVWLQALVDEPDPLIMARTKQTARLATEPMDPRRTRETARPNMIGIPAAQDEIIDNPDLTAAEAEKFKKLEQQGTMLAELKYIDRKWTEQGQTYFAETVEEEIPEQVNWWSQFALCLVRYIGDHTNKWVQKVCLQVNSPYLKDLLRDTIGDFPGVSFSTKDITIDKPCRCLFHYRHELESAGSQFEPGSEGAQHHRLLMDFINEEFKDEIAVTENLLEQGMINYEYLWAIFRPGSMAYAPEFGQSRAMTIQDYGFNCNPRGLIVTLRFVDFDGEKMGMRTDTRFLPAFHGSVKINALLAYPMQWHADPAGLRQQLVARGRRWEAFAGMHFQTYTGIGLETKGEKITRYHVNGRVVVDTKTYHRLNASEAFGLDALEGSTAQQSNNRTNDGLRDDLTDEHAVIESVPRIDPLTDDQCMLASSMVRGFAFNEKRWLDFFVDKLRPADWNSNCFDQLVLPTAQKELVKALVATHVEQRLVFDDIVKGKGKGLIFVLHGPPGVGKTLTAETVAEFSQRPLYSVSSGDLGTDSTLLDERLSRILDMASTWKAVLLIDEADIFLERRSLHDLQRNSLVSIFLRVLEYYQGILFLTSNRVDTFDEAFKSRIHVPLKYNELSFASRKRVWMNFLPPGEGEAEAVAVQIDDNGFDRLARAEINGRQIKNVIRTAKSLAHYQKSHLDCAMLEQVIAIQEEFEQELELTNVVHVVNDEQKRR